MENEDRPAMKLLLQEIRRNPLLWLLVFVPIALAAEKLNHEAHTLHFVLSVLAILPLAVLLSHATESVAAKTGDSVGGLLNATLGNLTELVIAIAALQAGQYTLVKASIAGAIVTNSLFMLGACVPARRTPLSRSGIQPCRCAIPGRLAFSRHNSASDPVCRVRARFVGRRRLNQNPERGTLIFAFARVRSRPLVFTQHASRIVRGCSRGTRSGVADRSGARHIGGCYGFRRIGKRSVCRIRSVRGDRLRNEPCLRWVYRCGPGGRGCRNGGCIFRRAQKSSRFEREHCTWQRRADCALRCSGSGTAELFDRPRADGFEFLARCSRDDSVRNAHRISGDHVWTLRLVRRRARDPGLSDIRHGALSFATPEYLN